MSDERDDQPTDDEFWLEAVRVAFAKEARKFPKERSARRKQSDAQDAYVKSYLTDAWKESKSVADALKDDLNLTSALFRTADRTLARLQPAGRVPARIRPGRRVTLKDHKALTDDLKHLIELLKALRTILDTRPELRRAGSSKGGRPPGNWLRWQSPEYWVAVVIEAKMKAWRKEHDKHIVPREVKNKIENDEIGRMEKLRGKRLNRERILTLLREPKSRRL